MFLAYLCTNENLFCSSSKLESFNNIVLRMVFSMCSTSERGGTDAVGFGEAAITAIAAKRGIGRAGERGVSVGGLR